MNKPNRIRAAALSVLLAAFSAYGLAWAAEEIEENFPMTSAQRLEFVDGTATMNAIMEDGGADVFFFQAYKGNKITVDIDSGDGTVDTIVSVHHPAVPTVEGATPYQVIDWNDDGGVPDDGTTRAADSYLSVPEIKADGVYYVAVTGWDNRVMDGGEFRGGKGNATGAYRLIVSGVVPPENSDTGSEVKKVSIDIKPGLKVIARINPKAEGYIPVALLSSEGFDATSVNVDSLRFGHTGDEQSLRRCNKHGVDVNRDGLRDLICHFDNQKAAFEPSDERAYLKGTHSDGTAFEGEGNLKVVPHKRHGHRWAGDHRRGRDQDRDGRRHR